MSNIVERFGVAIDLSHVGKVGCPRCMSKGQDHSGDNFMVYGLDENDHHKGGHCFSCEYTIPSYDRIIATGGEWEVEEKEVMSYPFNEDVHREIKSSTTVDPKMYRGIDVAVSKFFGVRYGYNDNNEVEQVFYPVTKDYTISGYKTRIHPKDFTQPYGMVGKESDMFGQFRFKTFSDTCVIVGGEHDQLAAYQMLLTLNKDKRYNPTAVVSPTVGESACHKQIQQNYTFFNQFKKIIVCMDNDEAGRVATERIVKALPRGKAYVMLMRRKDPNSYIWDKESNTVVDFVSEFISDFFAAKPFTPAGVTASTALYDAAMERMDLEMISLPPFMRVASAMLGGGLVLKEITLILAKTSIGKCLGKNTQVMLSDGSIKLVQDVVVGDKLMGPDGGVRNVLSVTSGKEMLYTVKQDKGDDYVVNESHILSLVYTASGHKHWGRGEIVNIEISDYLKLTATEKRLLKGYKANPVNFGVGETFEPYMFGLWLADGTTDKAQFTFNKADKELLEEFENFCKRNGWSSTLSPSADREGCVSPCVVRYGDWLKSVGVMGYKHIPAEIKKSSYANRIKILSGFLDGDGYNCGNVYEVTMKKGDLCEDVVWLAESVGLSVSVTDKFSKCGGFEGDVYSRLHIKGDVDKLSLILPRKRISKISERKNNYNNIVVEEKGYGEYFGFCIDGDRLFCLGDFTVTHNTTLVSGLTRHWALHEPNHVVGVMSLEADAAKFSQSMLSYHLSVPLHRMTKEQRKEFLARDDVKVKVDELYQRADGTPTMYVCDDRGASWDQIKEKMLEMIISMGITILIVDPYSDLLSGMSVSEQEDVATWFKKVMKEYGITPIIISHVRKGANGQDAGPLSEDDAQGSSFLVKAAGQTIALERDKQADDPLERNRTTITILKNRDFSETGPAGSMYYDIGTANLYDFDTYMQENPELLAPKAGF